MEGAKKGQSGKAKKENAGGASNAVAVPHVKKPERAELQKNIDAIMAEINALTEKAKEAKAETDRLMNDRSGSRVSIVSKH
jgi:hypothetical protein